MCLYRAFSACLQPLNSTILPMAPWCIFILILAVYSPLAFVFLFLFLLLRMQVCYQTTLARLPFRLGLGRVWTPSFIFRTLSPICTLVRTRILFRFPLLFVSIWILARWSCCCIYVLLGSVVNYCDVTIGDNKSTCIACM